MIPSRLKKEFYQQNPHLWMRDRLGIPLETIDWTLNPEYKEVGWVPEGDKEYGRKAPFLNEDGTMNPEGWDGSPNPLMSALQALVNWEDVGIESGTGTGKTFLVAAICLWFIEVWGDADNPDHECMVFLYGPKEGLIKRNIWKAIDRLWKRGFDEYYPDAEKLKLEIRMAPDRDNWKIIAESVGVGAEEQAATKVQGAHAEHMLIIMDETPGIDPAILEALDNTCTGAHNIRIGVGNPDSVTDALHKLCTAGSTQHIIISSYDHPNVVKGAEVIPGAVTRESIIRRLKKYKEATHPIYLSRIRGVCPDTSALCLFTPKALAAARQHIRQPLQEFVATTPSQGYSRVYFEPQHTHLNRYHIFCDVAGDAGRGDWHAAVMFDRLRQRPAATIRMRGPREDYVTEIMRLCEMYRVPFRRLSSASETRWFWPLLVWEKNSVGALILEERVKSYPNLYRSRNAEMQTPNLHATVGWETTGRSRRMIQDELEAWGLDLYDKPWMVVDAALLDEMATFNWTSRGNSGRYEAQAGHYDDMVMAMGGALVINKLIPLPLEQDFDKSPSVSQLTHFERDMPSMRRRRDDWQDDGRWTHIKIPGTF